MYATSKATITKKLIYQEYCEWNSTNYHYERRCPRYKELWKVASGVIKKYNIELTHYDKTKIDKNVAGRFYPLENKIFVCPPTIFEKGSKCYLNNYAVSQYDGYSEYYRCLLHELGHAIMFHNKVECALRAMDEVIVIETIKEFFDNVLKYEYSYDILSDVMYYEQNKNTIEMLGIDMEEFNKTKEKCKKLIIDTFKNYLTIL